MKVKLRLFGYLALKVGRDVFLEAEEGATVADVLESFYQEFKLGKVSFREPGSEVELFKVLMDGSATDLKAKVKDGCELTLLPPISGG